VELHAAIIMGKTTRSVVAVLLPDMAVPSDCAGPAPSPDSMKASVPASLSYLLKG